MGLNDLRIGYAPYSKKLDKPGDRRRFFYYTQKRNIKFEFARPTETYDLVYVTHAADLSVWNNYQKGNAKIVYDFIDSYLAVPKSDPKGVFRGLAKYASGQYKNLQINHWKTIQSMCQRADAVACTTLEQKSDILPFCSNVHLILDIKSMYDQVKKDYARGDVFNIVWEGLPHSMNSFREVRSVLANLKKKHKIALHLVTALQYGQYMGKYWKRNTTDYVRDLFQFDDIYLYQWHEQLCSHIMSACDMALVPLLPDDLFDWGKPEDKLLIFWLMGLPTLASANPSHLRAMDSAGLAMACHTQDDWMEALERYMRDEELRREAGLKGRAYASEFNSDDKVLKQWDDFFNSVIS